MRGCEQRKHKRVQTRNLISFLGFDAEGFHLQFGMAQALDISQKGLLLESGQPVESEYLSLMAVDPDNRLIAIVGKVVHTRREPSGSYRLGIELMGTHEENHLFAVNLVKCFHYARRRAPNAGGRRRNPRLSAR